MSYFTLMTTREYPTADRPHTLTRPVRACYVL